MRAVSPLAARDANAQQDAKPLEAPRAAAAETDEDLALPAKCHRSEGPPRDATASKLPSRDTDNLRLHDVRVGAPNGVARRAAVTGISVPAADAHPESPFSPPPESYVTKVEVHVETGRRRRDKTKRNWIAPSASAEWTASAKMDELVPAVHPSLKLASVAGAVSAESLAKAVHELTGVEPLALRMLPAFHGTALLWLRDPLADAAAIRAVLHERAWMSTVAMYAAAPKTSDADTSACELQRFASSIPEGSCIPRQLVRCCDWTATKVTV
jgi:hypothetical protein